MFFDRVEYYMEYNGDVLIAVEEPIGWNDETRSWIKNKKQHGISVEVSRSLTFYNLGFEMISKAFYADGVNAKVKIIKEVRDSQTDAWSVEYEGNFDFTTYSLFDDHVKIKINGNPLASLFKSNYDKKTRYRTTERFDGTTRTEIDEVDRVEITPKSTKNIYKLGGDSLEAYDNNLEYKPGGAWRTHIAPLSWSEVEGWDNGVSDMATSVLTVPNISSTPSTGGIGRSFWNKSEGDFELNIVLKVNSKVMLWGYDSSKITDIFYRIVVSIYNLSSNLAARYTLFEGTAKPEVPTDININGTFSKTVNVLKDQSIAIEHYYGAYFGNYATRTLVYKNYGGTATLDVTSTISTPSSEHDFITFKNALKCAVDVALGVGFESDLLSTSTFKGLGILNGFMIRKYANQETEFLFPEISIKELADSLASLMPIGIAIHDGVRLEGINYFYQEFTFEDIGIVQELEITVDAESLIKGITTGYDKYQTAEDGGDRQEYNNQTSWISPIDNTSKDTKILNKYRADSGGIQFIRNFSGNKTESEKNDETIWILDTKKNGSKWKTINWSGYFESAPKGIYDPENAINLRLTPANILSRQLTLLGSALSMVRDKIIRFTTSKMVVGLSTQLIGEEELIESADFDFTDYNTNLNIGLKAKFKTYNRIHKINGYTNGVPNYYGLLKFNDKQGKTYFMYIDKMVRNRKGTQIEGTIKKILL